MSFTVPRHVESSWSRDLTHVPCIGSWVLNHGQPLHSFLYSKILFYFALGSFVVFQSRLFDPVDCSMLISSYFFFINSVSVLEI